MSHMPSAEGEDWILRVALSVGEEATALHAELGSKLLQLSAELQTQVPSSVRCVRAFGILLEAKLRAAQQPCCPVERGRHFFAGC